MAEQVLFLTLLEVYRRFRDGKISPSEGERLFQVASRQFDENSAKLTLYDRIVRNHAEMWKSIESAAANYVMSGRRTTEADELVEAIYGCELKPAGKNNTKQS